jgi:hypothetical protein
MFLSRRECRGWFLAALVLGLAASSTARSAPASFPTTEPVSFVIIGDTGTGKAGQYAVARAIESVCAQRGCQFALGLGDNIYEFGPRSASDPQFEAKFEKPYARLRFPFFMVLGNHDQSGLFPGSGVRPEHGDYEVEYTRRSSKWLMPARYYRFSVPFASPTDWRAQGPQQPVIEFFGLDTNHLAPQNKPVHDWYRPGEPYDLAQRKWLRDSLATSRASWKIVFAHHPHRNNGKHGSAGEFFGLGLAKGRALRQMYQEEVCGKADLLLTGHDHSLQWLMPQPACGARPHFIISGAAADTYSYTPSYDELDPAFYQTYGKLGFFWATATADSMTLAVFTVDPSGAPKCVFEKTLRRPTN